MYQVLFYGGLAGAAIFGGLSVVVFFAGKVKAAFGAIYWAACLQKKGRRRQK